MKLRLFIKRILFPGTDLVIRQRGKVMKKYLLTGTQLKILDAGCGNGYFSFLAYERGSDVLGVSMDEASIARNRKFRDYKNIPADRVDFKVLNLYDLEQVNGTFDQIICLETLEHIKDDMKILRLFYEKLNDNGRLYLGVPNAKKKYIRRHN